MANPRSLIRALYQHWDIIEQLVLKTKEQLTWEISTLLPLIKHIYISESPEQHQERFNQLTSTGILIALPRSSDFEVNSIILDFVNQLLNEYELSSPDLIKAHITEIKIALQDLQEAMQNYDMAKLQRGIYRINTQLQEMTQRIEGDAHAIADIIERAKTADNQMPLSRRYNEVLETYNRYILPMTELMDIGVNGLFYPLLEKTEQVLNSLRELLKTQGGLISHQRSLQSVNHRISEFKKIERETLKNSFNALILLREEFYHHSQLNIAVTKLVSEIRKRGLKHAFDNNRLPLWRKEQSLRIIIDDSLLTFMAQAQGYTPKTIDFPDIIDRDEKPKQEWLNYAEIEQHLMNSLPIEDLMFWILENYGQYQDSTLIKLYHRLCRLPPINAEHQNHQTQHKLKHYFIYLYSHRLAANEYQS